MDVLREEYREVYQHLQQRFTAGDLATGASDSYGQHRQGGAWTVERLRLHHAILDEAKAQVAGLPRGGQAVLLTSGPPGAGKGTSLRLLSTRQGDDTELGQALAEAHGVDPADYVVLDPDQFKEAIIRHGGAPALPPQAHQLPGGRRLAPAELAPLVHRESSFLQDAFESWAREQGFNLLYDGVMKNFDKTRGLLGDLAQEGYGRRVVLSVEVPMQTSLEQNALRWQEGRAAFDTGLDAYGGRMAPEPLIRALYPTDGAASFSVARANAERLHAEGMLTGLIRLDRGQWAQTPAPGPHSPAIQHQSTEVGMRVSTAAARSRSSTRKKPPITGTPTPGTGQSRPRHGPDGPEQGRGRSK
ncbi:zeta toxin family protein [Streptomyces prasinus]|uniref:zeta toxin family protein n=1 Tax=Streptomyces prasinus TaxID=67345 RepID=UPI0006EB55CE|nr:zeta toxin family protein [Streptomyces prasinus]